MSLSPESEVVEPRRGPEAELGIFLLSSHLILISALWGRCYCEAYFFRKLLPPKCREHFSAARDFPGAGWRGGPGCLRLARVASGTPLNPGVLSVLLSQSPRASSSGVKSGMGLQSVRGSLVRALSSGSWQARDSPLLCEERHRELFGKTGHLLDF